MRQTYCKWASCQMLQGPNPSMSSQQARNQVALSPLVTSLREWGGHPQCCKQHHSTGTLLGHRRLCDFLELELTIDPLQEDASCCVHLVHYGRSRVRNLASQEVTLHLLKMIVFCRYQGVLMGMATAMKDGMMESPSSSLALASCTGAVSPGGFPQC